MTWIRYNCGLPRSCRCESAFLWEETDSEELFRVGKGGRDLAKMIYIE
jgi:hypothetical protein